MYYGEIKRRDIANGPGVRVALFVSGCTNACEDCFNKVTWDFHYGQPFTAQTQQEILSLLRPDFVRGFSLLGGEPFEPANQPTLTALLSCIRRQLPQKDIWCYTGFVLEQLLTPGSYPRTPVTEEMLSYIDVLVDGRYEKEKKNLRLKFRGSENQRLIDMNATRKEGTVITVQE